MKKNLWRSNTEGEPIRRHNLSSLLPLDVPLSIDVEASSVCCLKCRYCPQSINVEGKRDINIGQNGLMDIDLFREIINQIKEFPHPMKNIRFAGFGEPLLNKNIVEMVELVRNGGVAETITIFSNGIPLTREISEGLAENVDTFLFDIQGTCAADYKKWCDTNIDFDKLVENIRYLHGISRRGKIFCKTFRTLLDGRGSEFFAIFEDICDEIGIEDLYEIYPDIDYSDMVLKEKESEKCGMSPSEYCAYPWYQMAIDAAGRVTACTLPVSKSSNFLMLGHVRTDRLYDMWNGEKLNHVRYSLLKDRDAINECKNCKYTDLTPKEDWIDGIVGLLADYCIHRENEFMIEGGNGNA